MQNQLRACASWKNVVRVRMSFCDTPNLWKHTSSGAGVVDGTAGTWRRNVSCQPEPVLFSVIVYIPATPGTG